MKSENKPEKKYELVNSMSGCGIDETESLFTDEAHPYTSAIELVSDYSDFFGDYDRRK